MTGSIQRVASVLHTRVGRIPVLCCVLGAALLVATGGSALAADIAAPGLLAAGFLAGGFLERRNAHAMDATRLDAEAAFARLLGLCGRSAHVWQQQIETVRSQGDEEVAQLARTFAEICERLEGVIDGQHAGGDATREALRAGLQRNDAQLQQLVDGLRELQDSKQGIVREIRAHSEQLKENAAEIRQIALNIRIVALNATIEAARAGAAGQPFSVIVGEMRELAARTAHASDVFSRHTDRLQAMVGSAFERDADEGGVSIAGARRAVQEVIASSESMLGELGGAVETMHRERSALRADISRALVALQFQDRASQILSHVAGSLGQMRRWMRNDGWRGIDERTWFDDIARDYSTHEEFRNHGGSADADGQPGSGVTFF